MHPKHIPAPVPDDDEERLEFLRALNILDTPSEDSFDRITETAKTILRVPIALVSLVDKERQWFKSKVGLNVCETSRDLAFCAHAILPKEPVTFIIDNALEDERFKYSDLVLGPPYIRFYAGAPLVFRENDEIWKLGTLCIIDTEPRTLRNDEVLLLETLARLVVAEIKLRKRLAAQQAKKIDKLHEGAQVWAQQMHTSYIGQVAHDLRTPLNSISLGIQALHTTDLSDEQRRVVDIMDIAAELMTLTCNKAIDHTKVTLGKELHAARSAFDLVAMLHKSERVVMGYTHESKGVSYEYVVRGNVAARIISDEDWVWQMLMNYLCNARKFTTSGYIRTTVEPVPARPHGPPHAAAATDAADHAQQQQQQQQPPPQGQEAGAAARGGVEAGGQVGGGAGVEGEERMMLRFSVADTGIGVRPEQVPLLFKPFGQLQDFSGGTGLGLFSVHEKVATLGGACGVLPNQPNGSIFWFEIPYVPVPVDQADSDDMPEGAERADGETTPAGPIMWERRDRGNLWGVLRSNVAAARRSLGGGSAGSSGSFGSGIGFAGADAPPPAPQAPAVGAAAGAPTAAEKAGGGGGGAAAAAAAAAAGGGDSDASKWALPGDGKLHVLVVEDDVPTRTLMAHGLKRQGLIVYQAGNGDEGLKSMQERMFNIVLCDVMMPVMDGLECLRRLREWEPATPGRPKQLVVALSANTDQADVKRCMEAGMSDFYPKPVNIKALVKYIESKIASQ